MSQHLPTEDAVRMQFEHAERWREAHSDYTIRVGARAGEIFRANGFDEEYWAEFVSGGIYELWRSERGQRKRVFRTGDSGALMRKVIIDGLTRQGKRVLKRNEFEETPEGFRLRDLPQQRGVLVEWGDDSWAEFLGRSALPNALKFCRLMRADVRDIDAALASSTGEPLLQRQSLDGRQAPPTDRHGDFTVALWKRWMRDKEGADER